MNKFLNLNKNIIILVLIVTSFFFSHITSAQSNESQRDSSAGYYLLKSADVFFSSGKLLIAEAIYLENVQYLNEQQKVNLCSILVMLPKGDQEKSITFKLVKTIADQKSPTVKAFYGRLYSMGYGVERDIEKGKKYLEESAAGNDQWGYLYYAWLLRDLKQKDEAVTNIRKSIALGNSFAMVNLGEYYERGIVVPVNFDSALFWYKKSAERGDGLAYNQLGWMYYSGRGVDKDYNQSFKYFNLSNSYGNIAYSQLRGIGFSYTFGRGVDRNIDSAIAYFTAAAKHGDPSGYTQIGLIYENIKGNSKSTKDSIIKYYGLGFKEGDVEANRLLGNIFLTDKIVPHNYEVAANFFHLGSEKGSSGCKIQYAKLFKDGKGVKKDFSQYISLLKEASEIGNSDADNLLGLAYDELNNYDQSAKYLALGAERNNTDAMLNYVSLLQRQNPTSPLINTYLSRVGMIGEAGSLIDLYLHYPNKASVPQDRAEKVFKEILIASSEGNFDARSNLVKLYLYGIGTSKNIDMAINTAVVNYKIDSIYPNYIGFLYRQKSPPDNVEALKWFNRSIAKKDNDSKIAMRNIAFIYFDKKNAQRDTVQSVEYFKMAAEAGDVVSMETLGAMYLAGSGMKAVDVKSCLYWFEKAAQAGEASAQAMLGNVYLCGYYNVPKDSAKAFYWLEKGAMQGNSAALNDFGECYYTGFGVTQDFEKARYYYQLSADQNEPIGKLSLGVLYQKGEGVKKDTKKAKELFESACKDGLKDGCNMASKITD